MKLWLAAQRHVHTKTKCCVGDVEPCVKSQEAQGTHETYYVGRGERSLFRNVSTLFNMFRQRPSPFGFLQYQVTLFPVHHEST